MFLLLSAARVPPRHSSLRLCSSRLSSPGAAATSLTSKARAMASPGRIELDKLSVEQLKGLKEQTDLEVNLLQDSLTKIRTATTRLESASAALHDLSLRPHGAYSLPQSLSLPASRAPIPWKKMLVPLTASLYVPGSLDDARMSSSTSALVTSSR
ncbi:hypothetical protein HU200_060577 [Digitaria exilis]|uniref:Uncharacterized protein n=1 Tax=Digitaria exilis TaxID=1010633 RepID=A0A835A906_9POAL|nr:hypothetical protein HU200_060577 [Digitaria exilis]